MHIPNSFQRTAFIFWRILKDVEKTNLTTKHEKTNLTTKHKIRNLSVMASKATSIFILDI